MPDIAQLFKTQSLLLTVQCGSLKGVIHIHIILDFKINSILYHKYNFFSYSHYFIPSPYPKLPTKNPQERFPGLFLEANSGQETIGVLLIEDQDADNIYPKFPTKNPQERFPGLFLEANSRQETIGVLLIEDQEKSHQVGKNLSSDSTL